MGLFLGFSFISLVEVFYYVLLRPFHKLRTKKRSKVLLKSKLSPSNEFHRNHIKIMNIKKRRINQFRIHSKKSLEILPISEYKIQC